MSYPFYDLLQLWTEQRWASIQDPTIPIGAYNKERREVCDYDFFFSAGFHGIKGEVQYHSW